MEDCKGENQSAWRELCGISTWFRRLHYCFEIWLANWRGMDEAEKTYHGGHRWPISRAKSPILPGAPVFVGLKAHASTEQKRDTFSLPNRAAQRVAACWRRDESGGKPPHSQRVGATSGVGRWVVRARARNRACRERGRRWAVLAFAFAASGESAAFAASASQDLWSTKPVLPAQEWRRQHRERADAGHRRRRLRSRGRVSGDSRRQSCRCRPGRGPAENCAWPRSFWDPICRWGRPGNSRRGQGRTGFR